MKKDQLPGPLWGGGWFFGVCLPGRDYLASLSQKAGPGSHWVVGERREAVGPYVGEVASYLHNVTTKNATTSG